MQPTSNASPVESAVGSRRTWLIMHDSGPMGLRTKVRDIICEFLRGKVLKLCRNTRCCPPQAR